MEFYYISNPISNWQLNNCPQFFKMEKLKKGIESLAGDALAELIARLEITSKAPNTIAAKLGTLEGVDKLLSSLSERDLHVFSVIANGDDGVTISELEKASHLKSDQIESSIESLKNFALVYIFKNRKHLNNKLDKLHVYKPVSDVIIPQNKQSVVDKLKSLIEYSEANPEKKISPGLSKEKIKFLESVYSFGGIITLQEAYEESSSKKLTSELFELRDSGCIDIISILDFPYSTAIILREKFFSYFHAKAGEKRSFTASNGYLAINNILRSFDIISTYGLYLTQQGDFRKVDRKRLSEASYSLTDWNGQQLSIDESSQLSLYLMDMLRIISLRKDAVFADLSSVSDDIISPDKLVKKIITKQKDKFECNAVFSPPFKTPGKSELESFINALIRNSSVNISHMKTHFFASSVTVSPNFLNRLNESRQIITESFINTFRFLLLLGLVEVSGGEIILSPIYEKITGKQKTEPEVKSLYINPDFSLIVPKDTVKLEAIYLIVAYSELLKNDVIINAKITKDSIIKAYKRGMEPDVFSAKLEMLTQNPLPQNLAFLLKEWVNQTHKIDISLVHVVHTNRTDFLEELNNHFFETNQFKQISDNYAIIKKSALDEVIKLAEKHKAVITLMNDESGEM